MTDMTAENMAKGLNVYRSGPKGQATRDVGHLTVRTSTTRVSPPQLAKLPPLRLKVTPKAS